MERYYIVLKLELLLAIVLAAGSGCASSSPGKAAKDESLFGSLLPQFPSRKKSEADDERETNPLKKRRRSSQDVAAKTSAENKDEAKKGTTADATPSGGTADKVANSKVEKGTDAAGRTRKTSHDAATLALIERELADAEPAERDELELALRGVEPSTVRSILRNRRMVKQLNQTARGHDREHETDRKVLADGSGPRIEPGRSGEAHISGRDEIRSQGKPSQDFPDPDRSNPSRLSRRTAMSGLTDRTNQPALGATPWNNQGDNDPDDGMDSSYPEEASSYGRGSQGKGGLQHGHHVTGSGSRHDDRISPAGLFTTRGEKTSSSRHRDESSSHMTARATSDSGVEPWPHAPGRRGEGNLSGDNRESSNRNSLPAQFVTADGPNAQYIPAGEATNGSRGNADGGSGTKGRTGRRGLGFPGRGGFLAGGSRAANDPSTNLPARFEAASSSTSGTGSNPARTRAGQFQDELQPIISLAEAAVSQASIGKNDAEKRAYIEKHVYLRMLYLMSGQQAHSLSAIPGLEPADQEFWQQMFWAMANYFDAESMPETADRAAQTVAQLRLAIQKLKDKARLELRNVTFCHKIASFGNYEKFARDEFRPGQPVLIYAEVNNFHSEPTSEGQYRTLLKSTVRIYNARGDLVEEIAFPPTEDLCRSPRRDYFHSYELAIPQRISLGPHVIKLTVEDQVREKVATYTLNFTVK